MEPLVNLDKQVPTALMATQEPMAAKELTADSAEQREAVPLENSEAEVVMEDMIQAVARTAHLDLVVPLLVLALQEVAVLVAAIMVVPEVLEPVVLMVQLAMMPQVLPSSMIFGWAILGIQEPMAPMVKVAAAAVAVAVATMQAVFVTQTKEVVAAQVALVAVAALVVWVAKLVAAPLVFSWSIQ